MIRVIAENGQCHRGRLEIAVDAAEQAHAHGAWAYKTQLLTPELIAQPNAPAYWHNPDGRTQREVFAEAGTLEPEAVLELNAECQRIGIEFIATPFDIPSLHFLADMGCRYVKIASGDITYVQLLRAAAKSGMSVILSTGASLDVEIGQALNILQRSCACVLGCTLEYPTPDANAHVYQKMAQAISAAAICRSAFNTLALPGFSDHTFGTDTALVAVSNGAQVLEKHYTTRPSDREVGDNLFALTPHELGVYVAKAQKAEALCGSVVSMAGHGISENEKAARQGARRCVAVARSPAGHVLTEDDLIPLRPFVEDGIIPALMPGLVGMTVPAPIEAGTALTPGFFFSDVLTSS